MFGLEQLRDWICEENKSKLGEGVQLRKIETKLIQLLYDLALNDDSIICKKYDK